MMSREIKFRGIPLRDADDIYEIADYDGTFVYGYYIKNGDGALIVGDQTEELDDVGLSRWFEDVVPETVGQYTGIKDAYGKEIYESDIVKFNGNSDDLAIVKFGEFGVPDASTEEYVDKALGFYFDPKGSLSDIEPFSMTTPVNELYTCCTEVIGDAHTNPELLEAQHDTRTD